MIILKAIPIIVADPGVMVKSGHNFKKLWSEPGFSEQHNVYVIPGVTGGVPGKVEGIKIRILSVNRNIRQIQIIVYELCT